MRKIVLYILIVMSVSVCFSREYRQEIHCKHFFFGYPWGSPQTNDLIIRDIYALSSNDSTKFADWVAYRLDSLTITGKSLKKRRWQKDPWLDSSETLEPEDYKNASKLGFDRGHQAPLADFKGALDSQPANYLSNITPQKSNLNQGPWRVLEEMERELVSIYKEVWVMTGPYYKAHTADLPDADENSVIPSGYWKIICILSDGKPIVRAFIFDQNTPRNDKVEKHYASIDEIEKITNLDFFWEMDPLEENRIESDKNPEWFYQVEIKMYDDSDE